MKSARTKFLAIAGVLVLLGVVVIFLQPGPPDPECVPEGTPYSGFVDDESGCPISTESMEKITDYESSPKPVRIVGLLIILVGLGVAVVAAFRKPRATGPPAG